LLRLRSEQQSIEAFPRRLEQPSLGTRIGFVYLLVLEKKEQPTAADRMMADSAVLAYYNMLRVQGWIGSLCLIVERELFGQASLSDVHGPTVGDHRTDRQA
jgi:hypothetical protein